METLLSVCVCMWMCVCVCVSPLLLKSEDILFHVVANTPARLTITPYKRLIALIINSTSRLMLLCSESPILFFAPFFPFWVYETDINSRVSVCLCKRQRQTKVRDTRSFYCHLKNKIMIESLSPMCYIYFFRQWRVGYEFRRLTAWGMKLLLLSLRLVQKIALYEKWHPPPPL